MVNAFLLRHLAILLLAVGLFAACTPTEVISTRDPDYSGTVESLHIQSSVSDRLDKLTVSTADEVRLSMVSRSVRVTEDHNVLEEEEEGPSLQEDDGVEVDFEKARSNEVSHVMLITEKGRKEDVRGTVAGAGNVGMYNSTTSQTWTFDVSLYDVEQETRVWRATVKQEGSGMTTQSAEGVKMAKELVTRLEEDELLPPLTQGPDQTTGAE